MTTISVSISTNVIRRCGKQRTANRMSGVSCRRCSENYDLLRVNHPYTHTCALLRSIYPVAQKSVVFLTVYNLKTLESIL